MGINPNKRTDGQNIAESVEKTKEMSDSTDELCELLATNTNIFHSMDFVKTLSGYIDKHERLLYVEITNCMSEFDERKRATLLTNMDAVVSYVYSKEYEENAEVRKVVLKLWDHVNLVKRQLDLFTITDEHMPQVIENKMKEISNDVSKKVTEQLISLIAIFTALSFLVFGGISSLDNIFIGAQDIPVVKLMIVGFIWCFCIMNLIFVFMFFIAKLTKLSIKSTNDINANIVQKYPLIFWSNFIVVFGLILACWTYYVRRYGYSCGIDNFVGKYPSEISALGFVIIFIIMFLSGKKIYKIWAKSNEKNRIG